MSKSDCDLKNVQKSISEMKPQPTFDELYELIDMYQIDAPYKFDLSHVYYRINHYYKINRLDVCMFLIVDTVMNMASDGGFILFKQLIDDGLDLGMLIWRSKKYIPLGHVAIEIAAIGGNHLIVDYLIDKGYSLKPTEITPKMKETFDMVVEERVSKYLVRRALDKSLIPDLTNIVIGYL